MAKRPRRSVTPLAAGQVQPGAVAASVVPGADGVPVLAEQRADEDRQQQDRDERARAFLTLARQRFRRSGDAESRLRTDMLDDLEFYDSRQWPDQILAERTLDKRPVLTINRLPQFVRQVMNQARRSRPAIQVNPVDNGADPDTAEVFQGICRNIETQSKAQVQYSIAAEHQVIMGRGWLRVRADYAADDSFDQEILIEAIEDPFTVYPDPAAAQPDYRDQGWCFIVERLPREEYDALYGGDGVDPVSATDFQSIGDDAPVWFDDNAVQIAEYYTVDRIQDRIADCLVDAGVDPQTGQPKPPARIVLKRAALRPEDLAPNAATGQPRVTILKERDTIRKQLRWAKIDGARILEGNADKTGGRDLPGSYIPVVPMIGEKLVVRGRKNLRGMVRDAKDPQRAYNFWVSAETEAIALAPRAPVIGAAGQFEGHEEKWDSANRRNWAYLEYNPVDLNGQLVPPPQRAQFDPNIAAIVQATMQADRDLKSVLGMFDASQERSPEQSGKAIIARQQQGEEGNSHFLDNQARAIEQIGRILIGWIPIYYDKPRMLRIIGLDEQPKQVVVHAGQTDAASQMLADQQQRASGNTTLQAIMTDRPFDLSVGRYDVTITVGPSYQSRRQESVEALIQLVQAFPQSAPYVMDILVGNMDWPGARQLAERLKKLVPPDAQDGNQEVPPQVQAQLQALSQQLELAMRALAEKDQIINGKGQELAAERQIKAMELDSRERVAMIEQQGEVARLIAQLKSDSALAMLEARLKEISQQVEHAHEVRMSDRAAERQATERRLQPPQPGNGKKPAAAAPR